MKKENENRSELISSNFGLVHSCANKFRGRGVEYDDLFQAGCVGLIKAADNFDKDRGFAFSTYAVPVILGEIRRIFRDGGTVKVGRALKERSRNAVKVREQMALKMGRDVTITELSEELGVSVSEAAELITVSMPALSLTVDDEKGRAELQIPTDPPEEEISEKLTLKTVIMSLEERERRLIELRYFEGLTQVKTAKELGMSQVQVSRKEKAILIKLRKMLT